MSDNEEGSKKSGYRLEYANSARAKCKGPKPCSGTPIPKGALRFGTIVDIKGNTTFVWRHWGCVTPKIVENMKRQFEDADELDGFDELNDADQERIRKAWEEGHVADEDIPDSARKPAADEDDDEDADGEKPAKKKAAAKEKKSKDDKPGKFKLEYASSGRAKCKSGCGESIGKDYLRLGEEVDYRGKKSLSFVHWGCAPETMVGKLKASCSTPEEIEGFSELKEAEQEKVKRAWEGGAIPDEDQGPGEPVASEKKKAPAKRAKKDADDDDREKPAKKRARKAKKDDDDDEEEEKPKKQSKKVKDEDDDEDEDEDEKPKAKRGAAAKKAAPAKAKAAPKKRASKKKQDEDESGEDFGADIDAVSGEDGEEEEEEPKPKRKPASKPASKSASKKASAPPSKSRPASKPVSRRKKQEETIEEEDYE